MCQRTKKKGEVENFINQFRTCSDNVRTKNRTFRQTPKIHICITVDGFKRNRSHILTLGTVTMVSYKNEKTDFKELS